MVFRDRVDAGRQLADRVAAHRLAADVVVLGLARGGVPVAAQVAERLGARLDVLIVRKVGLPTNPELAMGAIGPSETSTFDIDLIQRFGVRTAEVEAVVAEERQELQRRERSYRQGRAPLPLGGRDVVIIDDGLATGASMRVAVEAVRQQEPARVTVAVPVASPSAARSLATRVDQLITISQPKSFLAVGQFYDDFSPTSDDEVRDCLTPTTRRSGALSR